MLSTPKRHLNLCKTEASVPHINSHFVGVSRWGQTTRNPRRKLKIEIEPRVGAWWAETKGDQRHEVKKSPKQKDYPISVRGSRLGDLVETVGTRLKVCT